MTTTTQINITAKDQTSGAFASANNNLAGLASSALKTTAGLAGIGLSIAGAVEAVRGITQATIQFQKFNSTLLVGTGSIKGAAEALSFVRAESQRLGLDLATAAEQFGKLTAASKGSALEGKATRDIFSAMSEAAAVLGLSADETRGALNAFQQMISKGKVQAEELRGQLGERLPGAFQLAARAMGVTTAELDKLLVAGKVTAEDLLPRLAVELNKTFGSQAEESAKGLAGQINRMNTAIFDLKVAIGESGLINFLSSGIELATKLGNALTSAFGGGAKLDPIQKQVSLIQTLEKELESLQNLTHIPLIGDLLFDKKQADLLKFRIESATEDLQKLKAAAAAPSNEISKALTGAVATVAVDSGKAKNALNELNKAQTAAINKEHEYIKLLEIERKAHADLVKPYVDSAKSAEQRLAVMDDEVDALKFSIANNVSLEKAIELTTIARLEEKKVIEKDSTIAAQIQREIDARRGLADLIPEHKKLVDQTRDSTDQISQLWTQAGRNIQSTLANSIFNFFDDGLKGMLKNVVSTIGRIASEFAALKLAQSIGLASIFSGSGAALAGGIGGTGSSGGGLLGSIAGLGSSAVNLFSSGGGISKGVSGLLGLGGSSGIFSNAGGAGTAFIGGPGTALGGSGLGGLSSLGSSFGAAAGPVMAAFAVDAIGRALAGDKKLGGAEYIPVLGGFLAAAFGRGPFKFRQQSLQGDVSSSGFDGEFTNVFKSKGGLFVGNKHKSVTENLTQEQQDLFDTAISGFYTSASGFAKNLGLSTDLVDTFTQTLQIKSEKGKKLTEEAITEMLQGIGDGIAKNVLPGIDEFRKSGEKSFETFTRLSAEFSAISSGAANLGASLSYAKELVSGMSIAARSAFVDMAGGIDNLQTLTGYFADNYLTQSEKIRPVIEGLTKAASDLGFTYTTDVTREQVKALVQSQNISAEARIGLLKLLPSFDLVKNTLDSIYGNGNKAADSLNDFATNLQSIKSSLASTYQSERNGIESTISKFKDLAGQLRGFRDSLSLGALSPLTPGQKLEEARNQFNQTRSEANAGDQNALAKLPSVAQDFLAASQVYNASGAAYLSDFSLVQNVLAGAEKSALSQIDIAQSQLTALDDSVKYLIDINVEAKTTNDLLKELKIAVLSSSGNPGISTAQIQDFLKANPGLTPDQVASVAAQYGVSGGQLAAAGYNTTPINLSLGGGSVTDKQIVDFVNANRDNPRAIYDAAVANGVSSSRLSKVSGIALTDIEKFVRDNNLPSFAKGTDFIQRSGLAMVHRAEAIVPSSTTDEIKKLREELAGLRAEQNRQTGDMIKVTDITNRQNAQVIAKALSEAEKSRQWSDRSKAAIA